MPTSATPITVTRVQSGVRLDARLLTLLERLVEEGHAPGNLGQLIEEMVLHAFEGRKACAFGKAVLSRISELKAEIGMDYDFPDEAAAQVHDTGRGRSPAKVIRTQAGFRIETRMLKVLKAMAERDDQTLGECIEDIAYHQVAGECAYLGKAIEDIGRLKQVYGMDYDTHDNVRFSEPG